MALNFKKNIVVGVSVNPEFGLEVAQIDFQTQTVLKYGRRRIEYDNVAKDIADLDTFLETFYELFVELDIPKGSEVVLNLPTNYFSIMDLPAAMDGEQVSNAIEEMLMSHPIFQNVEPTISYTKLPNSTLQMTKVVCSATQKTTAIEIAIQLKKLGYKLIGIDVSVNSMLNALAYNQMVDISPDVSWLFLVVDKDICRIFSMQGMNYVDSFEEKVSIGEVLGDSENYATVQNAVNPIIKNLPSQRLFVVSNTNIISAKVLAEQLIYNAQIIHLDSNLFATRPIMNVSEFITNDEAKMISLGVIGAAINKDFQPYYSARLNLFNKSLGTVWEDEQPLVLSVGSLKLNLSLESMLGGIIFIAVLMIVLLITGNIFLSSKINSSNEEIKNITNNIEKIQVYLDKNKNVSAEIFDEGDEIRIGLAQNKNIYSYYSILGTEIPQKLWLTQVYFGEKSVIAGQSDNLESIYSFSRNLKDYNPKSMLQLQKLALASDSDMQIIDDVQEGEETESIITSRNADYYEFVISDMKDYEVLFEKARNFNNEDNEEKNNKSKIKAVKSEKKKSSAPFKVLE